MRVIRLTSFLVVLLFASTSAWALGACCSVMKGVNQGIQASADFSLSSNHEEFGSEQYTFEQSALNVRGDIPIYRKLSAAVHLGIPFQSRITNSPGTVASSHSGHTIVTNAPKVDTRGASGIIYGVGLSYALPTFHRRFPLLLSATASQSIGKLTEATSNQRVKQKISISEAQLSLLTDFEISKSFSVFGGVRYYTGNVRWYTNSTAYLTGGHEGNIAPAFGVHYRINDRMGISISGAVGHANLISLGIVNSFSKN